MFSKPVALLLLAASAVAAGPIAEGTYRITNVASQSTVRALTAGGQISVSSEGPNPGPFELWNLRDANNNGYTIENVGLRGNGMLDTFVAVSQPLDGAPVVTNRNPAVFNIDSVDDTTFEVKLQSNGLVWNVDPPVVPTGPITIRSPSGQETQLWSFTPTQA